MFNKGKRPRMGIILLAIFLFLFGPGFAVTAAQASWGREGSFRGGGSFRSGAAFHGGGGHWQGSGRSTSAGHFERFNNSGWGGFRPADRSFSRFSFRHSRNVFSFYFGGYDYFYDDGLFYLDEPYGYTVVPAPIGAIVYDLPAGYREVVINGVLYYVYDGAYYIPAENGYRVVSPPAAMASLSASANASQDSFTLSVPDSRGGYTAVTLRRSGQGFIGPQGEYYERFPGVEQLRLMYGK